MGGITREITIELAWPSPKLSQNARVHWAEKGRFTKASKDTAYWITKAALGAKFGPTFKFIHDGKSDIILKQIAHPPANYNYDRDGIDARLKAHRDGIAMALGVDDKFFRPTGIEWGAVVPNGKVVIEVQL
jgi:hypothetical protein